MKNLILSIFLGGLLFTAFETVAQGGNKDAKLVSYNKLSKPVKTTWANFQTFIATAYPDIGSVWIDEIWSVPAGTPFWEDKVYATNCYYIYWYSYSTPGVTIIAGSGPMIEWYTY